MTNSNDFSLQFRVEHLRIINVFTNELSCDLTAFGNRGDIIVIKGLNDLSGDLSSSVFLVRVTAEFSGSIRDDPIVNSQSSSFQVRNNQVGFVQSEISVWIWRSNV
ncbi:hypothetical protein WICPIJ_010089 [Wickerhamomyces pijperi]|uniref:Uncharacterized protein n=1 Tax=Wickerhamomyces pijperi TaxID=599730 RepID=A0A9P8PJ49_WICPI|nr:hypothetical protein WICPIJ_010089 [Wickerhamomyces pijperi]